MNRAFAWNASSVVCALWLGACASTTPGAKTDATAVQSTDQIPNANQDVATIAKDLPTSLDGEIRRAQLLRAKGDYDEAGRALVQLMLVAPDNAKVVGEYGKLLVQQGRPRDAVAFLNRAAQLQPKDWTLYSALGVAYDQSDDHAHARLAYEHALAISPGEPTVLNNMAVSRMLAGNFPDAQKLLTEAATHGDASPKIANNMAMLSGMKDTAPSQAKKAPTASNAPANAPPPKAQHKTPSRLATAVPKTLGPNVVMQRVPVDPKAGPVKPAAHHAVRLAQESKATKKTAAPAPSSPPALRTAAEAD